MRDFNIRPGLSAPSELQGSPATVVMCSKPGLMTLLVISGLNDKNGESGGQRISIPPKLGLNLKECIHSQELNAKAGVKSHDTWPSNPPQHNHGRPKDTPRFRL